MRKLPALLILAILGCGRAELAPSPDDEAVAFLLAELPQGNAARVKTVAGMIRDLGPGAAPAFQRVLTRRRVERDPENRGRLRALGSEDWTTPYEQLLRQGERVEADLWETVFAAETSDQARRSIELLALIDNAVHPPGTIVDILVEWGAIPAFAAAPAAIRIVPKRDFERDRRFGSLREDLAPLKVLKEIDEANPFRGPFEETLREPDR